ncbi:MAG TPA: ABC transporter ATP-binding protein [Acidobacteriota bacterium]|nr:ABC transporter ATP-binding protein [Acidobacteriota bacterium]
MLLKVENIEKVFTTDHMKFKALHGVNTEIAKGEFVVIAGPSGSGKTTLLNIIGTLDSPTGGFVFLDGNDVSALSESKKAELRLHNLGFIFQAYNLINVLSAVENVEYVLQLQGIAKARRRSRALELLKAVGLEGLEYRRPNQLSGGQQQRVAVARALASEPDIVLADEPTANLDQATGRELMQLMLELNRDKGITFVIASHDEMVIEHARRLLRLLDGRIIADVRQD